VAALYLFDGSKRPAGVFDGQGGWLFQSDFTFMDWVGNHRPLNAIGGGFEWLKILKRD
jgi:hypothetical protein